MIIDSIFLSKGQSGKYTICISWKWTLCSLPSLRAVNSIWNASKKFSLNRVHFCAFLYLGDYYLCLETLEEAELPLSEKGLNILEDYYLKKIENYKTAISCDVGNIQINESDIKYEIHGSIFSMKTKYFMILPK